MPCDEVLVDVLYMDDKYGIHFSVDKILPDRTGYERLHEAGKRVVNYIQMDDGDEFPTGTEASRTEEDFKQNFSLVNPLHEI